MCSCFCGYAKVCSDIVFRRPVCSVFRFHANPVLLQFIYFLLDLVVYYNICYNYNNTITIVAYRMFRWYQGTENIWASPFCLIHLIKHYGACVISSVSSLKELKLNQVVILYVSNKGKS